MEEFMIDELKAKELSPLDGRYADIKELLSPFFSEYAYVKYRVFVEIKWLIYLIENNFLKTNSKDRDKILNIYNTFDIKSYLEVKKGESITNHDVKAIEYYIDKKLKKLNKSTPKL